MEKIIETLRRDGIALLPEACLAPAQALDVELHLCASPCFPGHVKVYGDGLPRSWTKAREECDVWCHDMSTVVTAPHFWELALSLFPTVAAYLETDEPHLYSMNAFWARASDSSPMRDLQTFHRDHDDERFVALFVYGTDVLEPADGPHRFVRGSHTFREDDADNDSLNVYGPAGTAFLADTRGLHMGMKPTRGERLILWARWCVSERPWSYDQDKLSPVHIGSLQSGDRYYIDARTRELVKLVLI